MKFFYFYEDLLTEARYFSNEKFDWVAKNIGTWILDSTIERPQSIRLLPLLSQFKEWLASNTNKPFETDDDIILATDQIEGFLNFISPRDSQRFMKEAMERFPLVKSNIASYLKSGKTEEPIPSVDSGKRRGRPAGSKNKPKIDLSDPRIKILRRYKPQEPTAVTNISLPEPEVEPIMPEPVVTTDEPSFSTEKPMKKMGRPKIYNDELSSMERNKFKREGPGMIKSLEGKAESLNYAAEQMRQRILKIMDEIAKRKKYWGQE